MKGVIYGCDVYALQGDYKYKEAMIYKNETDYDAGKEDFG
jgi:hypothetical protein